MSEEMQYDWSVEFQERENLNIGERENLNIGFFVCLFLIKTCEWAIGLLFLNELRHEYF